MCGRKKLTKASQEGYTEAVRLRAQIYGAMASATAGKEIRVFGIQRALTDRFNALTDKIHGDRDRAAWGGAYWLMAGDAIFMAAYVAAIGWVLIRAARGEIGIGDVALTVTMSATLVGAITMVTQLGQTFPMILLTVERFHWLEDSAREAVRAPASAVPPPAHLTRGVVLEAVSFAYPDRELPALSDVSLTLPAGSVVALVGENGSGKSTLVKLLCGFYRPSGGRILVDGRDLADIPTGAWRARVSAAFQDYVNFEFLMHESVGVGRGPANWTQGAGVGGARSVRRRGPRRATARRARHRARTQVGRDRPLRRPVAEAGAGAGGLPRAAAPCGLR